MTGARPDKPSLSLKAARRYALTAQGMSGSVPDAGKATRWKTLEKQITALNLLQIDSVNVVCRSHYLPLFSRLGAYDQTILDRHTLAQKKRKVFEYWAHEASLLPFEFHPLLRWRMDDARNGKGLYKSLNRFAKENAQLIEETLQKVRAEGPMRPRDFGQPAVRPGEWWGWNEHKTALEYLFWTGRVTTSSRDGFERLYDVPERVLPDDIHFAKTPSRDEAMRQLIRHSARALGIATFADLKDYFRLPPACARRAVDELSEEGELIEVNVRGWKQPAYLWKDAKRARTFNRTTVLSPFDPVVWHRERAERLYGFRYRIEIYTPAPKRQFGYYVLPVLHGEALAGRLCVKADRQAGILRINAAWHEAHGTPDETAEALAPNLNQMARWLGLETVEVESCGNFATELRTAIR